MKDHDECYAIVRVDDFLEGVAPVENQITVKLITWDLADAEQEVKRLDALNGSKGCRYFWRTTRARRRAP